MRDNNLPLHLKYRPQSFDEITGNEATVDSLKINLSRTEGAIRTYLLTGQPGCGKTTITRIIKSELKCSDQDFYDYNISKTRGIATAREIIDSTRYAPMNGNVKIYVLNEVHEATQEFQNAMLDILEHPPSHVRFILVTTDPDKLLSTVLQRCTQFHVVPLLRHQIIKILKWVCNEEKVKVSDKILTKITDYCDGSPREAVKFLDQVIDIEDEDLAESAIISSSVDEKTVLNLCQALVKGGNWKEIVEILKSINDNYEKTRLAICTYMSKVLLSNDNVRIAQMLDIFKERYYSEGKSSLIRDCYWASKAK